MRAPRVSMQSCLKLRWCLFVASVAAGVRQKVAIVADVGVDDAGALFWALASSELEILGVAATFGCHWDVRVTAANARRVLKVAGRSDVPVYVGSRWPLGADRPLMRDGRLIHGNDSLGGLGDTSSALTCQDGGDGDRQCSEAADTTPLYGPSSPEFLVQVARAFPGEVTVLCFSPLTDVALATLLEPSLPRLLRALVAMGGALYHPGNVSPLTEANFGHDAAAARVVVKAFAEKPLVLAPLDVTMKAFFKPSLTEKLKTSGSASARFFAEASKEYQRNYCEIAGECNGFPLHDAHTVAFLIEPSLYSNVTTVQLQVLVSKYGLPEHGMCLLDRRPKKQDFQAVSGSSSFDVDEAPVRLLLDVNVTGFQYAFFEHITRLP
eukprot:TRINITY_DN43486_c0_g1_i1.p1 TRINITY_DN43486_c0_g1~~TRINITY_DN43486_c0_g1_i1.p1  ORF type:complete len:380 (-),score=62.17 TRINITY_DN43486_c0_g1_i1:35-1174(-)